MKEITRNFLMILLYLLVAVSKMPAQAPQQFNYQAVARNAGGTPLINQSIAVRLKIHSGTANGIVEYSETRTVTTNAFGLFTFSIGSTGASNVTGSLATVSWNTGDKFLQVETDPAGGNNFTDMGTTQLLSVPYALNSGDNEWLKTGNNISNKNSGNIGIGITSPVAKLQVEGSAGISGKIGIGTAIPAYDMHIVHPNPVIGFTDEDDNQFSGSINGNSTNLEINAYRKPVFSNNVSGNLILQSSNANLTAGFVGIGTLAPTAKLDVNGGIKINGEINRPNTGAANLIPLCYGMVHTDGSIWRSTGNFNVARVSPGFYDITLSGDQFTDQDVVIASVNYSGNGPRIVNTGFDGYHHLLIWIYSLSGNHVDGQFEFVVYRL